MYKLTPTPHNFGVSLCVALLSFVFAGFTLPASGQIGNVTNNTSTPTPGLGHDFIHMLNETVNPANGSVSVRVQVPVPKSRGITLPFAFAYDSNGAHFIANGGDGGRWRSNLGYLSQGGWSYAMPLLGLNGFTDTLGCDSEGLNCYKCDYFSTYLFQDSSGARHDLNMAVLTGSSDPSCTAPGYSPYPPYLAGGDEFFFSSMSQSGLTVNISDLDGTSYNFNENYMHPVAGSSALSSLPSVVEDRNGNKTVINDSGGGAFSVTDSLGRAAFSSSGFGASGNTLSVSGFTQPYRLSWGTATSNIWLGFSGNCSNTLFPAHDSESQPVVNGITLPNSQQYQFGYDSTYGLLSQITYPSGGWVKYTWGINPKSEYQQYVTPFTVANCFYDWLAVTHRYVSFDGTNIALQQDFNYSTTWNSTQSAYISKQTIVTTRDLVRNTSFVTTYVYGGSCCGGVATNDPYHETPNTSQIPVEQTITYQDLDGKTLRTVAKEWYEQDLLKSEQETLDDGSVSKKVYNYLQLPGQMFDVLTETDEYGYGQGSPGPLLRKTDLPPYSTHS